MFNRNRYSLLALWHLSILSMFLVSGVASAKVIDVNSPKVISHLVAPPKSSLVFAQAVEYILPDGWKVVCPEADLKCRAVKDNNSRVYWKKGEDWKYLLNAISASSEYDFYLDWDNKALAFSRGSFSALGAAVKPKAVAKAAGSAAKKIDNSKAIAKAKADLKAKQVAKAAVKAKAKSDLAAAKVKAAAKAKSDLAAAKVKAAANAKAVTKAKAAAKVKAALVKGPSKSKVVSDSSPKEVAETIAEDVVKQSRYSYAVSQNATLREVASDMADALGFEGVMYSLGGLDISKSAKKDYIVRGESLTELAAQINWAYDLASPVYLYEAMSGELVMSSQLYNNPSNVRVFDVKQDTLLSNIQRLAKIYGWKVIAESWPYDFHFQEQYNYPVVIDGFDTGLGVLLKRYPVQAQLIDNAKHVVFVSRPLPIQGAN